jgi:histidinol-phosphate/aromatic aminotransferase/cobyric acid decarboxylase-like protein
MIPRIIENRCLILIPSYTDCARACIATGKQVEFFPLPESKGFSLDVNTLDAALTKDALVFIGQPNNPTGAVCNPEALRQLARRRPDSFFVIDEAFADFAGGIDRLTRDRPSNMIALLSLTKCFAIPGLRLGIAAADVSIIRRLREIQPPWSVNALALAAGAKALRDIEYLARMREYVDEQRNWLSQELGKISGFTVYPGRANFLLLRVDRPYAPELANKLLARGIAVRDCRDFNGLDSRFIRVAVRTEEENSRLIEAVESLDDCRLPRQTARKSTRRTPSHG